MHSVHSGRSPEYLADIVKPASIRSRRPRSTESSLYEIHTSSYKVRRERFHSLVHPCWTLYPPTWVTKHLHATFKKEDENILLLPCVWLCLTDFIIIFFIHDNVMHVRSDSGRGTTTNFCLFVCLIDWLIDCLNADMLCPVKNRCANLGCSPLCLLKPAGAQCMCPDYSHFLYDSNTTCDAGPWAAFLASVKERSQVK